MKKRALFLSILTMLMVFSSRGSAVAAACVDAAKYGSVSVTLPVLPSRGEYTLWSRMQIPDDEHSQYELEVNGQDCYQVGGASLTPGQWGWVSFEGGNLSRKVSHNFDHTSDNMLKLIGSSQGVKVDKILAVKGDCVPSGLGNNCQTDTVTIDPSDTAGATEIPPISNGPVSGIVIPSPTISRSSLGIAKVLYVVDGQTIHAAVGNGIDTTLLANGSHRIAMQITKSDGSIINESTTLVVDNKQTAFSPVRRWIRLHERSAIMIASVTGGILVLLAVFLVVRHVRLKKRLLEFKGF